MRPKEVGRIFEKKWRRLVALPIKVLENRLSRKRPRRNGNLVFPNTPFYRAIILNGQLEGRKK